VDELSTQVHDLDVRTSVVESKIDDIRDDIKDIKTGVRSLLGKK
jgi:chaperonin cofactor prefoldin